MQGVYRWGGGRQRIVVMKAQTYKGAIRAKAFVRTDWMIECFKNETDVEEERHIPFDLLSSYTVYGINSVQWLNLSVLPPL